MVFIKFILKNKNLIKYVDREKPKLINFRKRTKSIDMRKNSRYNGVNNKRRSKEKWLIQKS